MPDINATENPDYSKENIDKCMDTILGYLKTQGQFEKANVIKKTFEQDSDKVAIPLNYLLEKNGKKSKDKVISCDKAAAMVVYFGYSRAQYQWLKNFTDDLGICFLPSWKKTRDERKKCLAEDFECSETEAKATVKATLYNYMDRIKQDPDIMTDMKKLKQEHGDKITFQLLYKVGYDGSTQTPYKVSKKL